MPRSYANPKCVLITGASSGIGEALALAYAGAGRTLFLTGRNRERLDSVAERCRERGATVDTASTDVTEMAGMRDLVETWFRGTPVDLVIANAGISGRASASENERVIDGAMVRDIFAVNLAGVINTIEPAATLMAEEGGGQIAIMSSLAGFRGLPSAPAYAASKAAVRSLGEGLRGQLADNNIAVNVICPGFVESRITDENEFPMPFFMDAESAAKIIKKRLARNRGRIAFPWPMYFAIWLFSILPVSFTDWLAAVLPRKS